MSPFLVLAIGVIFVIVAIAKFKAHPFIALILAAMLVGMLSPEPLPAVGNDQKRPADAEWNELVQFRRAFEHTAAAFGSLVGKIGIVIALAAIIGQALMASGAADKIVRRLLRYLGEKRANWALLGSGYFLSIPVFFDTVFFLLIPIARATRMRTGGGYMGYVLAICAGGALTHGLVPPTPGPLFMADTLGIDLGFAILGGFLIGLPVAYLGGIILPIFLKRFYDLPMRDVPGTSEEELQEIVGQSDEELPSLFWSVFPVALPVVLITTSSIVKAIIGTEGTPSSAEMKLWDTVAFLGDKNFAMLVATIVALAVLKKQKKYSLSELTASIQPAMEAAGVIILITAAGGAFGAALKGTGIGDTIESMVSKESAGVTLILVAWGVAAIMKIAQGSGTVAMITTAGIMAPILVSLGDKVAFHPIYVLAAIAFGSKVFSWMNDSGFWVVSRMSGFDQKEALKTWTLLLGVMGVLGLIEVLILIHVLPLI